MSMWDGPDEQPQTPLWLRYLGWSALCAIIAVGSGLVLHVLVVANISHLAGWTTPPVWATFVATASFSLWFARHIDQNYLYR